uniref:Uncharacterized protein n=1 Tax=Cacopsylla melanoneura TaxID=428564 RepID=A0A8D9DST8_9HEMI
MCVCVKVGRYLDTLRARHTFDLHSELQFVDCVGVGILIRIVLTIVPTANNEGIELFHSKFQKEKLVKIWTGLLFDFTSKTTFYVVGTCLKSLLFDSRLS